jgi:hypothetical protein
LQVQAAPDLMTVLSNILLKHSSQTFFAFSLSSTGRALISSVRLTFPILKAPQPIEASLGQISCLDSRPNTGANPAAVCELLYPRNSKVLMDDKRAMFAVSSQAQRAADYLNGLQPVRC